MATSPNPAAATLPPPKKFYGNGQTVNFQVDSVPPAQYLYVTKADVLGINTLSNTSSTALTLRYRYLTPESEVKETTIVIPVTQVGLQFTPIELTECWILSLSLNASGGLGTGQWVYAQVFICRGFLVGGSSNAYGSIWEGYVPAAVSDGWPGTPTQRITDGAGTQRSINGTQPGAGAEISESVPANRRWILLAFRATLTTSATVGNRQVNITLDDGLTLFVNSGSGFPQTASTGVPYHFFPGAFRGDNGNSSVGLQAPTVMNMRSSFRIRTSTLGLLAGDQWSAPQYVVLEWGTWDGS
jgi:hypothetical protein